ncbi:hypothetical protein [Pantoea dispersa]|uniref:hypothetical protein n=1 Tax=Pantoea dispersa TaxID=59814 RepID=UPI0007955032|nr:hypothetical protein [Pantoea dispersa]KTS01274.1 hypothetical protein NS375_02445 [Pantoea dispersa]
MKTLDGVQFLLKNGYGLCHISNFSDELKLALKNHLTRICHGETHSRSGYAMYRYKPTVEAFLERYEKKSANTQKGMIGEFLSHIIINELLDNFETASPFFNLEEKSIKKGFDLLLYSTSDHKVWITEVKSGELHKGKDANETSQVLLNTAYSDLKTRLNENEMNHWANAMNAASIAISQHRNYKDVVLDLLATEGEKTSEKKSTSTDNCVFFISSLFHNIKFKTIEKTVMDFQKSMVAKAEFADVFCLSIQKSTLNKVVDFLIEESKK